MTDYVDLNECDEMRELHAEGIPQYRIADAFGRSVETVRRHVREGCQHNDHPQGRVEEADKETIRTAMRELANTIERIPSQTDWSDWAGRPCTVNSARSVFDASWSEIVAAAGYPELPERSPTPIRTAAYEKPELCRTYDD